MDNLGIIELYEKNGQSNSVNEFKEKTNSTLHVETKKKKSARDTEWLDIIEQTIPYIDNIFRKPNRFIVNEEEIVKNTFKYRDYLNTMYQYQKLITELKNS